jgi:tRNA(Ile2) C34 agmatinyltransferase TiaS
MDVLLAVIIAAVILAGWGIYRVVRVPRCPVCKNKMWTWSYGVYKCDTCKTTIRG